MKHPLLSVLLGITCVAANTGAQTTSPADAWGEPVDGVQLRLALAANGPPMLPGELPVFEVQLRNQGVTAVKVNPEALIYANIEIDDIWYVQPFDSLAPMRTVVIAPDSQGSVLRTDQKVRINEMNAKPARRLELQPGPHRVRVRNLADSSKNVRTADGKVLALVSNRVTINIPELSATAANSVAEFMAREHVSAPKEFSDCANLVDNHVSSSRKWERSDYKVSYTGKASYTSATGILYRGMEFKVSHVDDFRGLPRGAGGTSILVQVDCEPGRVLRELHYQD